MGPQLCRTGAGYAGGRQSKQAGTGAPRTSPQLSGEQEEQSPAPLQNISLALRSVLPRLRGPQFALGVAARMSARHSAQLPAAPSRAPTCSPRVPQASRGGSEQAVPCPAAPRSPRGSPRLLKAKGGRGGSSSFVLPMARGQDLGCSGCSVARWLLVQGQHGGLAERSSHSRCLCEGFSPGTGPRLIPPQMSPPADCRRAFNLHSSQAV